VVHSLPYNVVEGPLVFYCHRVEVDCLNNTVRAIANSDVHNARSDSEGVAIDRASTASLLRLVQRHHLNTADQIPVGYVVHVQIAVRKHCNNELTVLFFKVKAALDLTIGQFEQIGFGDSVFLGINSHQVVVA
jgi:hypothetical protein